MKYVNVPYCFLKRNKRKKKKKKKNKDTVANFTSVDRHFLQMKLKDGTYNIGRNSMLVQAHLEFK